jgi:hypothetical protein
MPTTIKVFGNIKDVSRFAKRCVVTIKLINGPINEDPNLIVPTELVRQTDETGYFEAPLGLGNYQLLIGGDYVLFSVTDLASGDKNVVSLLIEDLSYTRDPYNSNWNGLRQGNIQFLYVAAPLAFTGATFDSGGAHVPGLEGTEYQYFCTFLTAIGETPASPLITKDLSASAVGTCVRLTFNVTDVIANVTKRRVWRSTSDEFQLYQVIAEIDPTLPTFDDVLPYGGYVTDASGIPDRNTTAGGLYASTTKVAQLSPETGIDFPFRVLLPFGQTLAFAREITLDLVSNVPLLKFFYNATVYTIGKIFTGAGTIGLVPNSAIGYTGSRVLREDGTWVAPSGGGSSIVISTYVEVDADYSVDATTDHVIRDVTSSGSITITLPDPTTTPVGQEIVLICSNMDTGTTSISGTTIGSTGGSVTEISGGSATFYNNGTVWVGLINAN